MSRVQIQRLYQRACRGGLSVAIIAQRRPEPSWGAPVSGGVSHDGGASISRSISTSAIRNAESATSAKTGSRKDRVVILGSGWAGYALARKLSASKAERILVSPRSHFVFTPLLASTSVGTLEFRAAIEPVRRLGLAEFHQAWATSVDFKRKVVRVVANTRDDAGAVTGWQGPASSTAAAGAASSDTTDDGLEFEVPYDKLVLAMGCHSQTFGIEGVAEHACFLRDVGDARIIRLRVLDAFEKAALPTTSEATRRRLLNFAVVGGGPTGIEFAAELHDLMHEDLSRLYPRLMPYVGVTVYDIAPKVLPMFDRNLANYATDMFRRLGITVKTEHHLQSIRRDGDALMMRFAEKDEEVGAGLVVWSTGLMQNPLTKQLLGADVQDEEGGWGIASDAKTGGVVTDGRMRVQLAKKPGNNDGTDQKDEATTRTLTDVFAIGDCATMQNHRLPATAQVASQQAAYLARQLNRGTANANNADTDKRGGAEFRFRNFGAMAYLGRRRAIHQSKTDELKGLPAWLLWRTAYLTRSMSLRNKVLIPVYWMVTFFFGRDISRF